MERDSVCGWGGSVPAAGHSPEPPTVRSLSESRRQKGMGQSPDRHARLSRAPKRRRDRLATRLDLDLSPRLFELVRAELGDKPRGADWIGGVGLVFHDDRGNG